MSAKDKAKNKLQVGKGKAKEAVGDVTDNDRLVAEGKKDEAAGNLKQAGEKLKDAVKG